MPLAHIYKLAQHLPAPASRALGQVWALTAPGPNGTVDDVERLCAAVLEETIRRTSGAREYVDRDDSLRFLLGEVVVLHRKYDPAKRHGSGSFSGYLFDRLRFRLLDYWRAYYGRNGQHRLAGYFTDDPNIDGDGARAADDSPAPVCRSRGAPPDPADDWVDALGGLHPEGDREAARPDGILGVVPGERAARLDSGPCVGESGSARAASPAARAPFVDCPGCGWRTYAQAPNGRPGWHIPEGCTCCGAPIADGGTGPPASTVDSAGAPHNHNERSAA